MRYTLAIALALSGCGAATQSIEIIPDAGPDAGDVAQPDAGDEVADAGQDAGIDAGPAACSPEWGACDPYVAQADDGCCNGRVCRHTLLNGPSFCGCVPGGNETFTKSECCYGGSYSRQPEGFPIIYMCASHS